MSLQTKILQLITKLLSRRKNLVLWWGSIPVYTGDDESGEEADKDFCHGQVTMANQKTADETNSKKKGFFGSSSFFEKKEKTDDFMNWCGLL